jgi:aspartyl-tRNA(Asn)/glutamyl-tRNA(Gln) amidotransferase subunit B
MRSKENAHDYRYFPEPDLVPLRVSEAWMGRIREHMPELPSARRQRFMEHYGLTEYNAGVLTATREVGDYFEKVAAVSGDARTAANWVMGDLAAFLKEQGKEITESPVSAENLGGLIKMIADGKISGKIAKEILPKMAESGERAEAIAQREGLQQISDTGALEKIIDEVVAANPKQVEQYRGGKQAVIGFLVGQVMKASRGQADPAAVNTLLKGKL